MSGVTAGLVDHPREVYPLAHVALWSVAGYAGLIGHLVLVMTAAPGDYGYGWTDADAVRLYGLFTGLVQCSPLLGGWMADTFLGQRRAVVLGMWLQALAVFALAGVWLLPAVVEAVRDVPVREVILAAGIPVARPGLEGSAAALLSAAAGHAIGTAAVDATAAMANATHGAMTVLFFGALLVFIAGFGLQSPTLAAMVGSLYDGTRGRREGGYTLLFMAAMVGFVVGALISGMIASRVGWVEGLASAGAMLVVAAAMLSRLRPAGPAADPAPRQVGVAEGRPALTGGERRRILVILALCAAYFVFIAAFEQWGGSFSLYVENHTDRVVGGFEVPTLWIHSVQALFVLIVGPIMLVVWNGLDARGVRRAPPAKMGVGLLLTAGAFLVMVSVLPAGGAEAGGRTHLFWPLAFYWVITFGQMTVVPVGQAFVSRESPPRLANTLMGVWLLFGGMGILLSGQIGALAEPLGLRTVYLGIVVGCTLAGVAALTLGGRLMRVLAAGTALTSRSTPPSRTRAPRPGPHRSRE